MSMPRPPMAAGDVAPARGRRVGQFVVNRAVITVPDPALAALVRDAGRSATFKVRALLGELANSLDARTAAQAGVLHLTGVAATERQLVGEALRVRLTAAQAQQDPAAGALAALVTQWERAG